MTTQTVIDYRRSDLRTNVLENPYWLTSAEVLCSAAEDKAAVLFSFPNAGRITIIQNIVLQVTVAVTGGTVSGTVGASSLATDAVTTGGDATDVDVDEYILSADITWGTAGYYFATAGTGSDWEDAIKTGVSVAPGLITGAATTVPAIVLFMASTTTIAAGKCRLHVLVTDVPGK